MAENCRLTSLLAPWESSPSISVTVRTGGSEMRRVPGGMSCTQHSPALRLHKLLDIKTRILGWHHQCSFRWGPKTEFKIKKLCLCPDALAGWLNCVLWCHQAGSLPATVRQSEHPEIFSAMKYFQLIEIFPPCWHSGLSQLTEETHSESVLYSLSLSRPQELTSVNPFTYRADIHLTN